MSSESQRRPLSADERQALERFLRLEISVQELEQHLAEAIRFELGSHSCTARFVVDCLVEPLIAVERPHLDQAIKKHAGDQAQSLRDWATILLLVHAYSWEGPDEDLIADELNRLGQVVRAGTEINPAGQIAQAFVERG